MRTYILLFCAMAAFLVAASSASAQNDYSAYIVKFKDKAGSPYSLDKPGEFLSQKAIEKRAKYHISLNESDLPVNPHYLSQLESACHCKVTNKSKWFNSAVIRLADNSALDEIRALPFVSELAYIGSNSSANESSFESKLAIQEVREFGGSRDLDVYGKGKEQIEMIDGHLLHDAGFRGAGMDIAVIDAGFFMVDKLPVFGKLRDEARILGAHDFVFDGGSEVYSWHTHGTMVLSIIAGDLQDSLIGTAPDANYYLLISENVFSETPEEEYTWAAAAEYCDSLGIDIINSSLGYSQFDDSQLNYSYSDMDGNTTVITRAADMAAQKGILVISSAGNEGDDEWHYITAPADGDSVLTSGAVNMAGEHAFFSSYGPSYDGRVKPDVATMGQAAAYASTDSTIQRGNGTSFSAPVLTGMAACLWQAFPEKSNMEILQIIKQSAHLYNTPNDSLGYGIPNFWTAYTILQSVREAGDEIQVKLFPNPCADNMSIVLTGTQLSDSNYFIYDFSGRLVRHENSSFHAVLSGVSQLDVDVSALEAGVYTLMVQNGQNRTSAKFIKINP